MTVDALMEIINLGLMIIGPISLLLLLWQVFLFFRERKKKKWNLKKERKVALLRWLTGSGLIWSAFAISNTFLGVLIPSEASSIGIFSTMMIILSGLMFLLSSALPKFRHLGHGLFWLSFIYVLVAASQFVFPSGANVYEVYANLADSYLGFFGGLFFLLTIIFTVKGLLAYDHKQPRMVKKNLEKMLQLCIGLVFLVISTGLMRSIALSFDVPETMKSFLLDTDSAAYRYSMLLYLFGSFIYLRQLFPYFRYGLMGLLSLSGAYLVFDLVNYIV